MSDDTPHSVELRPSGAWTADDAAGFVRAVGAFGETIASIAVDADGPEIEAEIAFATTAAAGRFFQDAGAAKAAVRDQLLVRAGPLRVLTVRHPDQLANFSVEYSAPYADGNDVELVFQLLQVADDVVGSARVARQFPLDPEGPVRLKGRLQASPSGPVWLLTVWRDVPAPNRFAGRRSFRAAVPATPLPPWSSIAWTAAD